MADMGSSLTQAMQAPGALAIAVVDLESGMSLGQASTAGNTVNLDIAAAGNTEVIKAKQRVMSDLGLQDGIEDILITLGTQYHLIRPIKGKEGAGLFLYFVLDRKQGNLALARHRLADIERSFTL